uniref:non-specific serine/threonine protein kinase n=1 Tax=Myxobolus squamalis TaxID=59785 RepID=A0A6B2FWG1_MYXSQ
MTTVFYDQAESNVNGMIIRFPNHFIRLLKSIGEGTYSYVYAGIDVENMQKYAIKQVSNHNERYESVTMNEIRALKRLKSKSYIIEIFDDVRIEKNHYILLEYCPISLLEYIQKRSSIPFEDAEIIKLLGQITKAVEHMHCLDPPLINRDLKIDNILLNQNCLVRLCDFGSATVEKIDSAALDYNQKCITEKNVFTITCFSSSKAQPVYTEPLRCSISF